MATQQLGSAHFRRQLQVKDMHVQFRQVGTIIVWLPCLYLYTRWNLIKFGSVVKKALKKVTE
jgi:hypothetical protein